MAIAGTLLAALGKLVHPAGTGRPAARRSCFLLARGSIADSAVTVYDITEVSVRQTLVRDRALGRVASTFRVAVGRPLVA